MGTRVTVNPAFESYGTAVRSLASDGIPSQASVVYKGRNTVWRVDLPGLPPLSVKVFRNPGWLRGILYGWLRPSKARRSYLHALRLAAEGLGTPSPVAFLEARRGGALRESMYVCLHKDARPIWRADEDAHEASMEGAPRRTLDAILRSLARDMALMHSRGIFIHDFTPGNILYDPAAPQAPLMYVDLNRITFGERRRSRLRRMFNSPLYCDETIALLLREYARAAALAPEEVYAEARAARRRYNRLKRLLHPWRYRHKLPR